MFLFCWCIGVVLKRIFFYLGVIFIKFISISRIRFHNIVFHRFSFTTMGICYRTVRSNGGLYQMPGIFDVVAMARPISATLVIPQLV